MEARGSANVNEYQVPTAPVLDQREMQDVLHSQFYQRCSLSDETDLLVGPRNVALPRHPVFEEEQIEQQSDTKDDRPHDEKAQGKTVIAGEKSEPDTGGHDDTQDVETALHQERFLPLPLEERLADELFVDIVRVDAGTDQEAQQDEQVQVGGATLQCGDR